MLQNAYFLAKIGADTAEIEQHSTEMLPNPDQRGMARGLPPRGARVGVAAAVEACGGCFSWTSCDSTGSGVGRFFSMPACLREDAFPGDFSAPMHIFRPARITRFSIKGMRCTVVSCAVVALVGGFR